MPHAKEVGVPGYTIQPWFGVYVSSKTPPAMVEQVRTFVGQAVNAPAAKAATEKRGQEALLLCGSAMTKLQTDEMGQWREVLKKAGIQPE